MEFFSDFLDFIYPKLCSACRNTLKREERIICSSCILKLPYTNYFKERQNPVFINLAARCNISQAASLFTFYKNGIIQQLLHLFKYDNYHNLGIFLGELMGEEILNSKLYQYIDYIVPVPMHDEKIKKRGYNQCDILCKGINKHLKVEIIYNALKKEYSNESQTKKNRISRWENVKEVFVLNQDVSIQEKIKNKNILLIDDVITTGATLESCARCLLDIKNVKVMIAAAASPNN